MCAFLTRSAQVETMKEQLLGTGLMFVITYLLLRFRDSFLGLGQNSSAQELQHRPGLADFGRVPANGNLVRKPVSDPTQASMEFVSN
jgi:hypothetical protein